MTTYTLSQAADAFKSFLNGDDLEDKTTGHGQSVRRVRIEAVKAATKTLGIEKITEAQDNEIDVLMEAFLLETVDGGSLQEDMASRLSARVGYDYETCKLYLDMTKADRTQREIAGTLATREKSNTQGDSITSMGVVRRLFVCHQQLMYEDANEDGKLWTAHCFMFKDEVIAYVYRGFEDEERLEQLRAGNKDSFGYGTILIVGDIKEAREKAAGLMSANNITVRVLA